MLGKNDISIDNEFKSLIPPLSDEERARLESNLAADGCRDPLVVWDEKGILLDGHNRHEICTRLDIPFSTTRLSFDTRDDAADWIESNQLGRRNLTPDQRSILRGRMYNREKKRSSGRADRDLSGGQNDHPKTAERIAAKTGVSEKTVRRDAKRAEQYEKLKETAPEEAEAVFVGKKRLREVQRTARLAEVKEAAALPDSKYRVIYADPPWKYGDQLTENYGAVKYHYPAMSIKELCDMPVADLCERDAVLFLWVTSPLLYEAAPIIKAWGFTYKTSFVWDKVKHNMGHYNSVRHEFLLICTRGSCTPDNRKLHDSVQTIERAKHSEKPEKFREIIEELYPYGKRLELFARREADGWDAHGNQIGGDG